MTLTRPPITPGSSHGYWLVLRRAAPYRQPNGTPVVMWWCRCLGPTCGRVERAVAAHALKGEKSGGCRGCRRVVDGERREVALELDGQGLSYGEIGRRMGMGRSAARVMVVRARKAVERERDAAAKIKRGELCSPKAT